LWQRAPFPRFPEATAGLQAGDLFTDVDGQAVVTHQDATKIISSKRPG